MGRYYLDTKTLITPAVLPRGVFLEQLLKEAGVQRKYRDPKVAGGAEIYVCNERPKGSAIFGIIWKKIEYERERKSS